MSGQPSKGFESTSRQLSKKIADHQVPLHPAQARTLQTIPEKIQKQKTVLAGDHAPSQNCPCFTFSQPLLPIANVNSFKNIYISLLQTHCIKKPCSSRTDIGFPHPALLLVVQTACSRTWSFFWLNKPFLSAKLQPQRILFNTFLQFLEPQVCVSLKTCVLTIPSAQNAFPQIPKWLTPSVMSGICSNAMFHGLFLPLNKNCKSTQHPLSCFSTI